MDAKVLEAQRVIMELRKVEIAKMAQLIRVQELLQEIARLEDSTAVQDKRIAELQQQLRDKGVEVPPAMAMPT